MNHAEVTAQNEARKRHEALLIADTAAHRRECEESWSRVWAWLDALPNDERERTRRVAVETHRFIAAAGSWATVNPKECRTLAAAMYVERHAALGAPASAPLPKAPMVPTTIGVPRDRHVSPLQTANRGTWEAEALAPRHGAQRHSPLCPVCTRLSPSELGRTEVEPIRIALFAHSEPPSQVGIDFQRDEGTAHKWGYRAGVGLAAASRDLRAAAILHP